MHQCVTLKQTTVISGDEVWRALSQKWSDRTKEQLPTRQIQSLHNLSSEFGVLQLQWGLRNPKNTPMAGSL